MYGVDITRVVGGGGMGGGGGGMGRGGGGRTLFSNDLSVLVKQPYFNSINYLRSSMTADHLARV